MTAANSSPQNVIGVLRTVNEMFKRFRNMEDNNPNRRRLLTALNQFAAPLLGFYERIAKAAATPASQQNKAALTQLYEALYLMTEIFYSLNWFTIPEIFETTLKRWMPMFGQLLSPDKALGQIFAEPNNRDISTPRERLRTSIVSCIRIYAEKYEEEFKPFFGTFLGIVVKVLMTTPQQARFEKLCIECLNFLGQASVKISNKGTFGAQGFLQKLVQFVIFPNLNLQKAEAEEFEDNPQEFISRDIEGSDKFTRRRSACDLLRNLRINFDAAISALTLQVIQSLLQKFNANPAAGWASKETAVQMYLAIAVSGFTSYKGVSDESINPHVKAKANIQNFFKTYLLHDLTNPNANKMLKAAALKYISVFRQQIASPALLPALIPNLSSPSVVVHSYAANLLERVLVMRNKATKQPRIPPQVILQQLKPIMQQLFGVVEDKSTADNPYVMKAVMRVTVVVGVSITQDISSVGPFIQVLVKFLCGTVTRICKKSTSPKFNHYVFEALAALVHACCKAKQAFVANFQKALLPTFSPILSDGDSDFYPYVLQMLAQMLSFHPVGTPLQPLYQQLLDNMVSPGVWRNKGLIPANVQLLQVYFRVVPQLIVSGQYHFKMLNRFQILLKKRITEEYAIHLVQTLFTCLPFETLKTSVGKVMQFIGERLASYKKGPYFNAHATGFLGFFVSRFGVAALKAAWQVPSFPLPKAIQVWGEFANRVRGANASKGAAIGAVMLITDPAVHRTKELFLPLVGALLDMLEVSAMDLDDEFNDLDAEAMEFSATGVFRKLQAAKFNDNVKKFYAKIPNTREYFRKQFRELISKVPQLKAWCMELKSKDHQKVLRGFFGQGGSPQAAVAAFGAQPAFGGQPAGGNMFGGSSQPNTWGVSSGGF